MEGRQWVAMADLGDQRGQMSQVLGMGGSDAPTHTPFSSFAALQEATPSDGRGKLALHQVARGAP